MASVLNTDTAQIRRSINTPDFAAPWVVISEADADTWDAIPVQYRIVTGSVVSEMDAAAKAAVDAAAQVAADDAEMAELRQYVYALKKQLRREINTLRTRIDLLASTYRVQAGQSEPAALGSLDPTPFNAGIRARLEEL